MTADDEHVDLRLVDSERAYRIDLRLISAEKWRVRAALVAQLADVAVFMQDCIFTGFHLSVFTDDLKRCHELLSGCAILASFDESLMVTVAAVDNGSGLFEARLAVRQSDEGNARSLLASLSLEARGITFDQSFLPLLRSEVLEFLRNNDVDDRNPWTLPAEDAS